MKDRYTNSFFYGQKIVRYLIVLVVILGLAALLLTQEGSSAQSVLVIASFALIFLSLVVMFKYCRCPHCGKRIIGGVLVVRSCPACKRDLETGKKVKKR